MTVTTRNFKVNIVMFFNSSSQRNCFHCSVSYDLNIHIMVLHQVPSFFLSWYVIKAEIGLQSQGTVKDHPEVLAQIFLDPIPALWQLRGNGWAWCSFSYTYSNFHKKRTEDGWKEITHISMLCTGEVIAKKGEGNGLRWKLLNISAKKPHWELAFIKKN